MNFSPDANYPNSILRLGQNIDTAINCIIVLASDMWSSIQTELHLLITAVGIYQRKRKRTRGYSVRWERSMKTTKQVFGQTINKRLYLLFSFSNAIFHWWCHELIPILNYHQMWFSHISLFNSESLGNQYAVCGYIWLSNKIFPRHYNKYFVYNRLYRGN